MIKVFFFIENASSLRTKVETGNFPHHLAYGAFKLEKEGKATVLEASWKEIISIPAGSAVIINDPKYALWLKLRGCKVFLINLNSNHIIERVSNSFIKSTLVKQLYHSCEKIVCLSSIQVQKLHEFGIKQTTVIPLGIDLNYFKKIKNKKDYYFTSGRDAGRNFEFVKKAVFPKPLVIVSGQGTSLASENVQHFQNVPYPEYIRLLSHAKAGILRIEDDPKASDLSGSITCLEVILLGKPLLVNFRPWLTDLLPKGFTTYQNLEDLQKKLPKAKPVKRIPFKELSLSLFNERLLELIGASR